MTFNQSLEKIGSTFLKLKDEKSTKAFLEDILTPKEILSIAERLAVLELLLEGKSQREVAKELGCAIATVTRGNRMLQYGTGGAKKFLSLIKKS